MTSEKQKQDAVAALESYPEPSNADLGDTPDSVREYVDHLRNLISALTTPPVDAGRMTPDAAKKALDEMPPEVYGAEYDVTDWFENNHDVIRTLLENAARGGG